jgi:hypothetical protein
VESVQLCSTLVSVSLSFNKVLVRPLLLPDNLSHLTARGTLMLVYGDRNATQTFPDTYSVCQKINYNVIRKNSMLCPQLLVIHAFTLSLKFGAAR